MSPVSTQLLDGSLTCARLTPFSRSCNPQEDVSDRLLLWRPCTKRATRTVQQYDFAGKGGKILVRQTQHGIYACGADGSSLVSGTYPRSGITYQPSGVSYRMRTVVDLLCEMIAIDSQSSVSNVPLANFMQSQLEHWEIERIDYVDGEGIAKTNIVAADPESASPLAFRSSRYGLGDRLGHGPISNDDRARPADRAWCGRHERADRCLSFGGSANGSPGAAENRAHRR